MAAVAKERALRMEEQWILIVCWVLSRVQNRHRVLELLLGMLLRERVVLKLLLIIGLHNESD